MFGDISRVEVSHVRGGKHDCNGGRGYANTCSRPIAAAMSEIHPGMLDTVNSLGWAIKDPCGENTTAVAEEKPNGN